MSRRLGLEHGLLATTVGVTRLLSLLSEQDIGILTVHGTMVYSFHSDFKRLVLIICLMVF